MTNVSLPEPAQFAPQMITEDAYTTAQLRAYGDARVRAAIEGLSLTDEEIERILERHAGGCEWTDDEYDSARRLVVASIAALKQQGM